MFLFQLSKPIEESNNRDGASGIVTIKKQNKRIKIDKNQYIKDKINAGDEYTKISILNEIIITIDNKINYTSNNLFIVEGGLFSKPINNNNKYSFDDHDGYIIIESLISGGNGKCYFCIPLMCSGRSDITRNNYLENSKSIDKLWNNKSESGELAIYKTTHNNELDFETDGLINNSNATVLFDGINRMVIVETPIIINSFLDITKRIFLGDSFITHKSFNSINQNNIQSKKIIIVGARTDAASAACGCKEGFINYPNKDSAGVQLKDDNNNLLTSDGVNGSLTLATTPALALPPNYVITENPDQGTIPKTEKLLTTNNLETGYRLKCTPEGMSEEQIRTFSVPIDSDGVVDLGKIVMGGAITYLVIILFAIGTVYLMSDSIIKYGFKNIIDTLDVRDKQMRLTTVKYFILFIIIVFCFSLMINGGASDNFTQCYFGGFTLMFFMIIVLKTINGKDNRDINFLQIHAWNIIDFVDWFNETQMYISNNIMGILTNYLFVIVLCIFITLLILFNKDKKTGNGTNILPKDSKNTEDNLKSDAYKATWGYGLLYGAILSTYAHLFFKTYSS